MSESDGPLRLRGAQREIRDAYFGHESGLFTLNCVPGSGKSVVAHHIAAEDVLRRYVDGELTPEQRVAVVSFNRDEAAAIVPSVCERLRELVAHDLTPVAAEVSTAEVASVIRRVRRAPFVGTVDGLLRDVLSDVVHEVGFEEMPTVGNDARLVRVHATCYDRVRRDGDHAARLDRLEAAYPTEAYEADVAEMLEAAVTYCRDRRLSASEFRAELEATVDAVYADGEPAAFDDITAAMTRFAGMDAATEVEGRLDEAARDRLVDADRTLHGAWRARVDDFCAVLDAYRAAYRREVRAQGVVSHTDVAYLVDGYFAGTLEDVDAADDRVLARYRARIASVVVDEAQDVSAVQHAALSHLVTPETRVFACGDTLQSIYGWRHADPTVFETAVRDGVYLGIDWETHETRTARTTYRCVPDVAAAVDAIAEPALTDAARGNVGALDVTYPRLDAFRDGRADTSVHVAAFDGTSNPGSASWVNPDRGRGEATVLAAYLSCGLADGTFTDADGEPLGITVLFRRRTRMAEYEAAFEAAGLRVWSASDPLFDSPVVEAVCDVCEWLVDPGAPDRLAALVGESALGLETLGDAFAANDWDLDAVAGGDAPTERQRAVLEALRALRDRRDAFVGAAVETVVEDIVEALSLRADPHGLCSGVDGARRVANLDALVDTLSGWAGDDGVDLRELVELAAPFRETPRDGPTQPSAADATHDVEFRTVHRAKGDQADVVALADLGFDIWAQGPYTQRFLAHGDVAGLAPPTNTATPTDIALPPYLGGVYEPDGDRTNGEGRTRRDAGLRWATEHWRDVVDPDAARGTLVGPSRLQRVAADARAESWRLLYVALTRARDHLVVPLPETVPGTPQGRDRWLDVVRDGLQYEGQTGSYTLTTPDGRTVDIAVNDVDLFAQRPTRDERPAAGVASEPPRREDLAPWLPRFVNPSTMLPLTEDPDRYVLDHLLGRALHTDTHDVPDDLPLTFETVGPDAVGTCLHAVLTAVVDRGLPASALREMTDEVVDVFEDAFDEHAPDASAGERDGLVTFFEESVRDDFLESSLWATLEAAETVAVEKPVDGLVHVDGVEFELHGQADFVCYAPDGERTVVDAKIALAEPTDRTRQRYELQVAAYAYLFEREGAGARVRPRVETFGVSRRTVTSTWPTAVIERRLAALLEDVERGDAG